MIKNLDTGEEIPLSLAEEKLPTGINPLTLHIMRRTKEYVRYEWWQLLALSDAVALTVFAYVETALVQVKRVPIHLSLTNVSANSQFSMNQAVY